MQKIPTNSETNRPNKTLFKRLAQKSCSTPTQVTPASTPSCESASCTSHETPDPGVGQNFRRLTIELSPQMFRLQQKIQNRNITLKSITHNGNLPQIELKVSKKCLKPPPRKSSHLTNLKINSLPKILIS